jgi:hypothetical protein
LIAEIAAGGEGNFGVKRTVYERFLNVTDTVGLCLRAVVEAVKGVVRAVLEAIKETIFKRSGEREEEEEVRSPLLPRAATPSAHTPFVEPGPSQSRSRGGSTSRGADEPLPEDGTNQEPDPRELEGISDADARLRIVEEAIAAHMV